KSSVREWRGDRSPRRDFLCLPVPTRLVVRMRTYRENSCRYILPYRFGPDWTGRCGASTSGLPEERFLDYELRLPYAIAWYQSSICDKADARVVGKDRGFLLDDQSDHAGDNPRWLEQISGWLIH